MGGVFLDWSEELVDRLDDPESRPAGGIEPPFAVSGKVTVSRDHGIYVYHLYDDQLGQGSSLGNSKVWAETKGTGDMLNLFSIQAGMRVLGGSSITYLLPFTDVSPHGAQWSAAPHHTRNLNRTIPTSVGHIHLHPAYQQREFVIGDGLHVLETFFIPRSDDNDPAAACQVVSLWNRTPRPIEIVVVASCGLRGHTPIDLEADYDRSRNAVVAWNQSAPDQVRLFGSTEQPEHYWATNNKDAAYSPERPLADSTSDTGDLTGALQFNVLLYPGSRKKIRVVCAISTEGRRSAAAEYDAVVGSDRSLKSTIDLYNHYLGQSVVEMPDEMLTHGLQWAKACLIRPVCDYKLGRASTNDPGNSSNIVGRDTAWYVHGCDFVEPRWSCSMLNILADCQREDGLIPEYVDGNTGHTEDFGFNINDATPLFIMAVDHHIKCTLHSDCLKRLYPSAKKAGELILRQRDGRGLVVCDATGLGPKAICSWRNVLQNQSISGAVTEVNSECFAALRALSEIAEIAGEHTDGERFRSASDELRESTNRHLANPENNLYLLNISPEGHAYTQATGDLVFPLIFGIAHADTADNVTARLAEPDFMTDAGIRVLPSEDPEYDPSFESGCMGGVWQGLTWWYAMAAAGSDPEIMASSLRRAYAHYVCDPKAYNTVPGQFSEWSDGQTLVNRGMRLSPWDSPRFVWAAIEGLAGLQFGTNGVSLRPSLPPDWQWLRVHNLPFQDGTLSYFLIRRSGGMQIYTANTFSGEIDAVVYHEELERPPEAITTGVSSSAYRKGRETLLCFGSNLGMPVMGPFLTHHDLRSDTSYRVYVLTSHHDDWQDLGSRAGQELQRIAVRIDKKAYALYRFVEEQ